MALMPFDKALRLEHPSAHDRQDDRRHDADKEHVAPAIAADEAVGPGTDERAERATRHHDRSDLCPVGLAERLGKQRYPDHQLGSGTEPGNKAIDGKVENTL